MCKCTPQVMTPFCGKRNCIWPLDSNELVGQRVIIIDKSSDHFGMIGKTISLQDGYYEIILGDGDFGIKWKYYFDQVSFDLDVLKSDESIVSKVDIRHQPHYEQFNIQPVVFIAANNLDFLTGNIIKYVLRHSKKNGVQDLEKAKHYLDMLIQKAKGEVVTP